MSDIEELNSSDSERKTRYDDYDDEDLPSFMPVVTVKAKNFLVPIVITIILAGILAYLTYVVAEIQITATPFSEEDMGIGAAFLNALFFTIIAGVSSVVIFYLVKYKGENALKVIMGFSFVLLGTTLFFFFGDIVLYLAQAPQWSEIPMIIAGAVVTVLMVWILYRQNTTNLKKNVVIVAFGTLIGAFMGIIMPTWTTVLILAGISIWDIISVKRGPIKKILELTGNLPGDLDEEDDEEYEKLSKKEKNKLFRESRLDIGIGDLAFYSVLTSHTLISTGSLLAMLLAATGITVGCYLTISLLKKNKILPGLPISIALGIVGLFLGIGIQSLLA